MQEWPTDPKPLIEALPLATTGGSVGSEIERVSTDNEWVISAWSPIHLRTTLKELGQRRRLLRGYLALPLSAALQKPRRSRQGH